ncbi:MAG: hypothetical protein ACO3JL_18320 [Myxococcota bacterium]
MHYLRCEATIDFGVQMNSQRWRSPFFVFLLTFTGVSHFAHGEVSRDARSSSVDVTSMASNTRVSSTKTKRNPKAKRQGRHRARRTSAVTVPIDVGAGPILLLPNPPLFDDQAVFGGVMLSLAAVIDKELIAAHKGSIPQQYRHLASGVRQARVRPLWLALVPSTLVLSPPLVDGLTTTGMYGATWRPFGVGVDLLEAPVRCNVHADLALSYLYLHSTLRAPTHFLRPGVTLSAVIEVPLTETLLVSTGWSSDVYVPQPLSSSPFTLEPSADWLWHLGGPFVKVHLRFPYTVSL